MKWWISSFWDSSSSCFPGERIFAGFNYFMFDYFPLYNKFRAPTICLIIVEMIMPLLGIMALAKIFDSEESLKVKDTTKVDICLSRYNRRFSAFICLDWSFYDGI